ncbi:MAG: hypothetical protein K0R93_152 [Anaerosolibacter sp.]|uniref:tagaturonate epimerase family protein n=1 Tax=Anaerosolibacter sp. TaxID=1872527 RepID=UPI0026060B22|nr:tagaturonate epimerase family protein [Anaerosolibacter sp.]MDF2545254.1 hypothetical protein [Anaerosolibacter sp.]
MKDIHVIIEGMRNGNMDVRIEGIKLYKNSFQCKDGVKVMMAKLQGEKVLLAVGEGQLCNDLQGQEENGYKICPLIHENRRTLNKYFDFTVPRAFGQEMATMGFGDRLGLASPGHIKTIKGKEIRPVLAQQSIRELNLTGRTYQDVLDAASFAVFQEGYQDGFGADGDHLKTPEDIKMALDLGFTMITLDCSEKIDNTISQLSIREIQQKYELLPSALRKQYEAYYLNKEFQLMGDTLYFDRETLMKNVLIYEKAIDFMISIYNTYIMKAGRQIDFEISIDETETPTTPEAHYFVAREIYSKDVSITSMAPRFCGEFQKAIDYIGDLAQFEREFKVHKEIADTFGYKVSIHSGSDKFSVYPIIEQYTKGRFHVKTAGTNWLEAMRVMAKVNPSLYRRMHQYALDHFQEAKAYYHVTTDIQRITPLENVTDEDLPTYMDENNARQLIHITYGILLQAVNKNGEYLFKDEFFKTLEIYEEEYDKALITHIGKHIALLGK